jgi:large subunit ribosomal protein L21
MLVGDVNMACFRFVNNFSRLMLNPLKFTNNDLSSKLLFLTSNVLSQQQTSCIQELFSPYAIRYSSSIPTPSGRKLSSASAVTAASAALHHTSDDFSAVVDKVNNRLQSQHAGRLFAVVHVAGKQRKVTPEDIIVIDKPLDADIGQRIRLNKVLLVGGKDFSILGRPVLNPNLVRVEATIIEKTLSHTNVIFWYKRRQNHRFLRLRRDQLTYLRINDIDLSTSALCEQQ